MQVDIDFSWDPQKAQSNLLKHQVSFNDAAGVLHDPMAATVYDTAHSDFEDRWFTLGRSYAGKLLAVSHTYDATFTTRVKVRLISAREATKQERQFYEEGS